MGDVDHRVELLEELRRHYQEFLVTNKHQLISLNWEIQTLKTQCNGLVQTDGALDQELGQYHDLIVTISLGFLGLLALLGHLG